MNNSIKDFFVEEARINKQETPLRIYEAIQSSGLTAQEISERCGVSTATVYNWENGTRSLSLLSALKLSIVLGTTVNELIALDTPNNKEESIVLSSF